MPRLGARSRAARLALPLRLTLALPLGFACSDPPQDGSRHEPMRELPGAAAEGQGDAREATEPGVEAGPGADASSPRAGSLSASGDASGPSLEARAPADPAIERTLELLAGSGRMFIDQASEPDERPSEYTAEQFASMLRTKWDWLGYDIVAHEPWLDEIATRSWKTRLPYLVVLEDGSSRELRPWLDALIERPDPSN